MKLREEEAKANLVGESVLVRKQERDRMDA